MIWKHKITCISSFFLFMIEEEGKKLKNSLVPATFKNYDDDVDNLGDNSYDNDDWGDDEDRNDDDDDDNDNEGDGDYQNENYGDAA